MEAIQLIAARWPELPARHLLRALDIAFTIVEARYGDEARAALRGTRPERFDA